MVKRVLILALTYFPFVGGAEVAVKEITDRIPDIEWEMITVNLDGQQPVEEKIGNILVHRVGGGKLSKYFFPFTAFWLAKKLHQQKAYNTIWAIMANQAGWAALKFKRKFPDVKYLLTLQEGDSELDIWLRTWFIRPLYKAIYRRADYIQAISNFLADRAKRLGAQGPIAVIPNGVRNEWLERSENDIGLKQLKGSQKIITVSRLEKKNGLEYLIRAMKGIEGKLSVIGDGSLRDSLKSLTKSLGLENKVEFLGSMDQARIYHELISSSVFCRPSLSEGLGNAFLEAMAVGVPVVGTAVGGIPDFLNDSETGLICEVKNPASIAEKIKELLVNNELRERITKNARQLVSKKFNWDKIALSFKEIF